MTKSVMTSTTGTTHSQARATGRPTGTWSRSTRAGLIARLQAARTEPAATKPTNARRIRLSQSRSGTTDAAHEPKIASPEANSPPKATRATSEIAAVRRTGHRTATRLSVAIVRPSSGSPRRAARGHPRIPASSGTIPLAPVRAVVVSTMPTVMASAAIHSAARITTSDARPAQTSAVTRVHGLARRTEARRTRPPPHSRTRSRTTPTSRKGSNAAARTPTPREPTSRPTCGGSSPSGQRSPKADATSGSSAVFLGRATWTAPSTRRSSGRTGHQRRTRRPPEGSTRRPQRATSAHRHRGMELRRWALAHLRVRRRRQVCRHQQPSCPEAARFSRQHRAQAGAGRAGSARDGADRSSASSRSAWASAARRASSSGVTTPSTRFSSSACGAVSGSRSSCETVATSWRRCRSAEARSAAMVADTVDGAYALRPDLGAQCLDVTVQRPGAAGVGPVPDLAHQLVPRPHGPRLAGQGHEQVELQRRQGAPPGPWGTPAARRDRS